MRKLKRVMALVLCFAMVIPMVAFAADENVIVLNVGFNGYKTNEVVDSAVKTGRVVMRGDGDKALSFNNVDTKRYAWSIGTLADSYVASFEVYFDGAVPNTDLFTVTSDAKKYKLYADADNGGALFDGKEVLGLMSKTWNKAELVVNRNLKSYSVYINGRCVAGNYKLPFDGDITAMETSFGFAEGEPTNILVDNFRVNKGLSRTVVFPSEAFNKTELPLEEEPEQEDTVQEFQLLAGASAHTANVVGDAIPFGISRKGAVQFETLVEDTEGKKWLRLAANEDPYINVTATTDAKKLYEEMEICLRGSNSTDISLLQVRGGPNDVTNLMLRLYKDNTLRLGDGTVVATMKINVPMVVLAEADLGKSVYNIYIDGKQVAKNIPFDKGDIDTFTLWRIYFWSSGGGGYTSLDVGRIALYAANEPTDIVPLLEGAEADAAYEYEMSADEVALQQAGANTVAFHAWGKYAVVNGERIELKSSQKLTDDGTYYITQELLEKGFNATVKQLYDNVWVNGTQVKGKVIDGVVCVELQDVCEKVLKQNYFIDTNIEDREVGLGIIGDRDYSAFKENSYNFRELNNYLIFKRPKADEILEDFKANGTGQHPRVLLNKQELDSLLRQFKTVEWKKEAYETYMRQAEAALVAAPINIERTDQLRWGNAQNGAIEKAWISLIFAYLTTKEAKYKDRLWTDIQRVASKVEWNLDHYLDTAGATFAFTIAYDWMYDYWTDAQRAFMEKTLIEKAIIPAENASVGKWGYQVDWYAPPTEEENGKKGNWTIVCSGSMTIAALALMDIPEYQERCATVAERNIRYIEYMWPTYAPDGEWEEGIGYWNYAGDWLSKTLSTMMISLGSEYGFLDYDPLVNTRNFPIYMIGPTASFAFGDASPESNINGPFSFYARQYGDIDQLAYRVRTIENGSVTPDLLDIIFLSADISAEDFSSFDLDGVFGGIASGSMRSGWSGKNDTWLAYHCGSNLDGHMHYDSGTFEFDAMGERWITELGADDYNILNYGRAPNEEEISYRMRAEGNNVYVINPSMQAGQLKETHGQKIVSTGSTDYEAFAVIDITASYANEVTSARRGYRLTDDRRSMILRDEITMKPGSSGSDFYSFMHTAAEVEMLPDGKSAILTKNGKQVKAEVVTNQPGLKLSVMEAKKFETSPYPNGYADSIAYERDNSMFRKLAVSGKVSGNVEITVKISPIVPGFTPTPIDTTPLSQWTAVNKSGAPKEELTIDEIRINGMPYKGFDPSVPAYNYFVADANQIKTFEVATSNPKLQVYTERTGDTYAFTIVQKDRPTNFAHYTITLKSAGRPEIAGLSILNPITLSASDEPEAANPGPNIMDGSTSTRWAAQGLGVYMFYEFDDVYTISAMDLSIHNHTTREQLFELQVSTDGQNYRTVLDGRTKAGDDPFTRFEFEPVKAKYVKLVGKRARQIADESIVEWNSLTEFYVYGK